MLLQELTQEFLPRSDSSLARIGRQIAREVVARKMTTRENPQVTLDKAINRITNEISKAAMEEFQMLSMQTTARRM